jgi:hypothetical protein
MLTITSRRITWMTPGSQCRGSPYFVRDRQEWRSGIRITYQLARRSSNCRFDVLVLTHDASGNVDIGWNVTGYPSLESAAAGSDGEHAGLLSLPLLREIYRGGRHFARLKR